MSWNWFSKNWSLCNYISTSDKYLSIQVSSSNAIIIFAIFLSFGHKYITKLAILASFVANLQQIAIKVILSFLCCGNAVEDKNWVGCVGGGDEGGVEVCPGAGLMGR